jgi:signal transduction histidine kinase/CheY-like chemotaxis protein
MAMAEDPGTRALNSLSAHIAVTGTDGTITAVNDAWRRFAAENGDPPPRSVGVGANVLGVLRAVRGPERTDAQAVLRGLERVLSGESPEFTYEYACHSPVQRRWFRLRTTPLVGGGLVMSHENTTQDRLLEERLAEESRIAETLNRIGLSLAAQLELQSLVQSVTDEATRLTSAEFGAFFYTVHAGDGGSLTLYALSGSRREAFEGFPIPRRTELFGPTFRGEGAVRLDDVTKDPRYGRNAPYRGLPEGHLPVRSYLAVPVVTPRGEVLGGLFFGHPEPGVFGARHERLAAGVAAQAAVAVENARLFERVRQANRAKDEFLAVMSHELRTPLNAIQGWTHILERGGLPPEDVRQGLEVIRRSVRSMSRLVADLLDVSRIAAGKLTLEPVPTDPLVPVRAAVEAVRPAAEAKSLRLDFDASPVGAPLPADPQRLQQVVSNLLDNAVKFTPGGGRIAVRLERTDGRVRISVSDTGPGIPAEFLPHVFERFRQAEGRATTRRHGGLGLGLAIVRHLVELHHGTVRVESPGGGRGTTFTVELPLIPAEAPPAEGRPAETVAPVAPVAPAATVTPAAPNAELLKGVRALVVDDEPAARDLCVRMLNEYGAEASAVGSADEALAALDVSVPDVLLGDIGMPGRDGYDLIREIRSRPPERGGRIPAAALTAFASADDRERALAAGYQDHIPKPYEPAHLAAAVARLAGRAG